MSASTTQAPSTTPVHSTQKAQNLKRKFFDSDDEIQILESSTSKKMKMESGATVNRPKQSRPTTVPKIEVITLSDDEEELKEKRNALERLAALRQKRKQEKEALHQKRMEEREFELERRAQKEKEARQMRMQMAARIQIKTRRNCHKTRSGDFGYFF